MLHLCLHFAPANMYVCTQEESTIAARRLPIPEFADAMGLEKGASRKPILNVNDVAIALIDFNRTGGPRMYAPTGWAAGHVRVG